SVNYVSGIKCKLCVRTDNLLKPGMRIYEGTAGNTGIGLATLAAGRGYKCTIVMPNNQAAEKYQTLEALGADLLKVDPVPFANSNHFYHTAKNLAEKDPQGYWANQFENLANFEAHYTGTGPEIWQQTLGKIDIFAAASGTGGTIAGVSNFLHAKNPRLESILIDPMGSGLYSWFHTGEIKSQGSSVTEGIGIMRLTANMQKSILTDAIQVNDQQMISMLHYLSKKEGLLVGPSAALNVYGAYQLGMKYQNSGKTIVTVLCDSALRYQSRVFNPSWLAEKNLVIQDI
ncbi:MAG: pyridoxal-phosphate dependent enzyme, partial [Pseudobdellovibrionaceae bacterium]